MIDSYKDTLPEDIRDSVSVVLNLDNLIKKYVNKYVSDKNSDKALPDDLKRQIFEDIAEDTVLF